jgi:hypothetical protein
VSPTTEQQSLPVSPGGSCSIRPISRPKQSTQLFICACLLALLSFFESPTRRYPFFSWPTLAWPYLVSSRRLYRCLALVPGANVSLAGTSQFPPTPIPVHQQADGDRRRRHGQFIDSLVRTSLTSSCTFPNPQLLPHFFLDDLCISRPFFVFVVTLLRIRFRTARAVPHTPLNHHSVFCGPWDDLARLFLRLH